MVKIREDFPFGWDEIGRPIPNPVSPAKMIDASRQPDAMMCGLRGRQQGKDAQNISPASRPDCGLPKNGI
jgi:hypothetical protein